MDCPGQLTLICIYCRTLHLYLVYLSVIAASSRRGGRTVNCFSNLAWECHGSHEQHVTVLMTSRDFATVPLTTAVRLSLTAGASDSSFCTACPIATYSSSSGAFARRARLDSERRHSLTPSPPTSVGGTCLWQQQGAAHLG
jgi:hypothetical protein